MNRYDWMFVALVVASATVGFVADFSAEMALVNFMGVVAGAATVYLADASRRCSMCRKRK